ncbi:anion permease [Escherichia coli]|nr:anion permease [Escherichia coli]
MPFFTGVIVGLILEPVPGAVVAMVGISIIAILSPWLLFSPRTARPARALNSLQNPSRGRFPVFLIRLSG